MNNIELESIDLFKIEKKKKSWIKSVTFIWYRSIYDWVLRFESVDNLLLDDIGFERKIMKIYIEDTFVDRCYLSFYWQKHVDKKKDIFIWNVSSDLDWFVHASTIFYFCNCFI